MNNLLIIILNYNCSADTLNCIDSLNCAGILEDIVVVDNCSTDDSFDTIRKRCSEFINVTVLQSEKNGGYSYGNNYGIKQMQEKKGRYRFICIMNPDVVVSENFFSQLCGILDKNNDCAAISPMMVLNGQLALDSISWDLPSNREIYQSHSLLAKKKTKKRYDVFQNGLIETNVLPGSFFIIKEDIFEKLGFWDENVFLYNEENILGIKMQNMGKKLLISTACFYMHNHKVSKADVRHRYIDGFKNFMEGYHAGYESRKYLCTAYYDGRYLFRLKCVNLLNIMLLYMKHWIIKWSYIIGGVMYRGRE